VKWLQRGTGRYFHQHGLFCSTHPFLLMYATSVVIIFFSYPAVRLFDSHLSLRTGSSSSSSSSSSAAAAAVMASPTNGVVDPQEIYEPIHFWDKGSATRSQFEQDKFRLKFASEPYLRIDQILVSLVYSDHQHPPSAAHNASAGGGGGGGGGGGAGGVLHKSLLHSLFDLQDVVANFTVLDSGGLPYSLKDICFQVRDQCLVNSPLEFWHSDKARFLQDQDILQTVSQINWRSSFGPPISVRSVFGGVTTDPETDLLLRADSLVLTYFLQVPADETREETITKWEHFWTSFVANAAVHGVFSGSLGDQGGVAVTFSFEAMERTPGSPKYLYYKFKQPSFHDSAEFWLLAISYFLVFLYISLSLGRIELVKSKFGLGLAAVFTIFASLVMSVGTCAVIGVELSLVPWYVSPSSFPAFFPSFLVVSIPRRKFY